LKKVRKSLLGKEISGWGKGSKGERPFFFLEKPDPI